MSFKVVKTVTEMRLLAQAYKNRSVGFTPTMGALHQGHMALVEKSKLENEMSVVSIFVNPTQFNNPKDYDQYPHRTVEDLKKLNDIDIDYVFMPEAKDLYPRGHAYKINETQWSQGLCGTARPGHFEGVLTVLMKMFNIVKPQKVYMGLKDYQQWKVVQGMCEDLFMDIDVVGVPTVRTKEGLALSSRNLNLASEQMLIANEFAKILKHSKDLNEAHQALKKLDLKVDYLEERWGRRFAAVFIGDVRLIDNVPLPTQHKQENNYGTHSV